jgi:hypothetical protein
MENIKSEIADKMMVVIKFSKNTNVSIMISKCAIER